MSTNIKGTDIKILILKGKHGDVLVAARDPEEEARAWLYLFKIVDSWMCYVDLEGDEVDAYKRAKEGDSQAAEWLLGLREDYEYEEINVDYVTIP